ncbi:hypothetical protein KIN20_003432 [Parelaphostrongylus tenuis]|uniref:Uncharacterized protein n=1 Tax=Parelaphostrongylus tenuis TaxID=148309 RepID=A0AAD5MID2_PARTN|nr:hypothetical protein KIN20_003432 [Parelaphostrongylus tenuis]
MGKSLAVDGVDMMMQSDCIVISGTVTALRTEMGKLACSVFKNMNIGAIDAKHLSLSGSLTVRIE